MSIPTRLIGAALAALVAWLTPLEANAQSRYEFLAPPSGESNRIYRVDTQTGAMSVYWFNGTHTECIAGTGLAGPQAAGLYGLERSNKPDEKGVFRVDRSNGAVSTCWVQQAALVCTHQVR